MDQGWIVIARKANDHPCLQAFDARGVWEKLLLLAAYRPHRVRLAGQMVDLERGQLARSVSGMAKDGGITRKRMRTIMSMFVDQGMIKMVQAKGHAFSLITICNYSTYQNVWNGEGQGRGQPRAKQGPTERTKVTKEQKNDSPNGESVPSKTEGYAPDFEALWKVYPRRSEDDKQGCYRHWQTATRTADAKAIHASAREWCAEQSANPFRVGLRRWLKDKHFLRPPPVYRAGEGEHSDPIGEAYKQSMATIAEMRKRTGNADDPQFTGTYSDVPDGDEADIWDGTEDDTGTSSVSGWPVHRSPVRYLT